MDRPIHCSTVWHPQYRSTPSPWHVRKSARAHACVYVRRSYVGLGARLCDSVKREGLHKYKKKLSAKVKKRSEMQILCQNALGTRTKKGFSFYCFLIVSCPLTILDEKSPSLQRKTALFLKARINYNYTPAIIALTVPR